MGCGHAPQIEQADVVILTLGFAAYGIHAYDVLAARTILLSEEAAASLEERLSR